jgi:hypothetical protein
MAGVVTGKASVLFRPKYDVSSDLHSFMAITSVYVEQNCNSVESVKQYGRRWQEPVMT